MSPTHTHHKSFGLKMFIGLGSLIMLGAIMTYLKIILLPMVLAFFITCILNPLAIVFQHWKLPRPLAILATLLLGLAIIWLTANFMFMSLVAFRDGFPAYQESLDALFGQLTAFRDSRFSFLTFDLIKTHLDSFSFGQFFGDLFNNFFSLTGYLLLTAVFILYFLPAIPAFPEKLKQAFPGSRGEELSQAVQGLSQQIQRYILAKSLLSAGLGFLVGLVCKLFGVDFATTWGMFAFFLNFIPTLGAVTASLMPAILATIQFGLGTGVWLLVVLIFIMALSGNFLEPLILGRSVNLSPTIAFLSILAWGWLWGGIGMIIAVPATAIVKFACDRLTGLKPVGHLMGSLIMKKKNNVG
ncbi:MAG: AI-2E family transporter [Deltaproteobacteria bacterium]|jgi:predicted PurR-regulated permease PerM|nr:AI-2E family transporter [Deltaproteobacteria bacterium]